MSVKKTKAAEKKGKSVSETSASTHNGAKTGKAGNLVKTGASARLQAFASLLLEGGSLDEIAKEVTKQGFGTAKRNLKHAKRFAELGVYFGVLKEKKDGTFEKK